MRADTALPAITISTIGGQPLQRGWIANIAAVNNVIAALQKCQGLRPQETVDVGDDAYAKHGNRPFTMLSQDHALHGEPL